MARPGGDFLSPDWRETQPLLPAQGGAGQHRQRPWPARAATLVLIATALERSAFYSLQLNLVYFLMHTLPNVDQLCVGEVSSLFLGTTYFLGLLFGLASDLLVPPFWGICLGYAPYLAGYSYIVREGFSTGGNATSWCPRKISAAGADGYESPDGAWKPYLAITGVAGTGGNATSWCSRNISAAGADGYESPDGAWKLYLAITGVAMGASIQRTLVAPFGADQVKEQGLTTTRSYYSWYYWSINFGSLCSGTGVAYLQLQCGYGLGFLVPLGLLLLSWLVVTCGYKTYVHRVPNRSAIKYFLTIILSGYRSWKARRRNRVDAQIDWLDYAKTTHGGSYSTAAVDNVKATGHIALVIVLMVPYFIIYNKTMSAFAAEGPHMLVGTNAIDQNVPVSLLVAFNDAGLLLTLPLCNMVIYPMLSRCGIRLTMYKRITIGMLVIILCLLTAGVVENARISAPTLPTQIIGGEMYGNVSNLTVFAQIPQYALLGASEAFAFVSVMEFIYVMSPSCLHSTMMGLLWVFQGLSEFVVLPIINIPYDSTYRKWVPATFYFILAGICVCTTAIFALVGRKYDLGLDALTIAEPPRSIQRSASTPGPAAHLSPGVLPRSIQSLLA